MLLCPHTFTQGHNWKKKHIWNYGPSCCVMSSVVCVWASACFVLCISPWPEISPHYWRTVNPSTLSYTNQGAQECGSSNHNTNDKACAGRKAWPESDQGATCRVCESVTDFWGRLLPWDGKEWSMPKQTPIENASIISRLLHLVYIISPNVVRM